MLQAKNKYILFCFYLYSSYVSSGPYPVFTITFIPPKKLGNVLFCKILLTIYFCFKTIYNISLSIEMSLTYYLFLKIYNYHVFFSRIFFIFVSKYFFRSAIVVYYICHLTRTLIFNSLRLLMTKIAKVKQELF